MALHAAPRGAPLRGLRRASQRGTAEDARVSPSHQRTFCSLGTDPARGPRVCAQVRGALPEMWGLQPMSKETKLLLEKPAGF